MKPYIICHMVASIDGQKGETAIFDGIAGTSRPPVPLRLQTIERLEYDMLWLWYKTK